MRFLVTVLGSRLPSSTCNAGNKLGKPKASKSHLTMVQVKVATTYVCGNACPF